LLGVKDGTIVGKLQLHHGFRHILTFMIRKNN
jgi:hypothetical protein